MLTLILLFSAIGCLASLDNPTLYSNMTMVPSSSILDASAFGFGKRQEVCPVQGPICSDGIHCCAAGQSCCGTGYCCGPGDNCFTDRCCSEGFEPCNIRYCCKIEAVCCQDSLENPCCPLGSSCCGNTCCPPSEICERGNCISADLVDMIARFDYSKENELILKHMCQGQTVAVVETFTYSGKDSVTRAENRKAAGCVRGTCQGHGDNNSCDEWPPASSQQGGLMASRDCVPQRQNSYQGGVLGQWVKKWMRDNVDENNPNKKQYPPEGTEFIVSIPCDKIPNGDTGKRELIVASGSESIYTVSFSNDQILSYVLVPLGDLEAGSYSVAIQCTAGSTTGAFVFNNQGENATSNDFGITLGQSQQLNFTLDYDDFGLGILIGTWENSTTVSWNIKQVTTSSTASSSTSVQTSQSSASIIAVCWVWIVAAAFASWTFCGADLFLELTGTFGV